MTTAAKRRIDALGIYLTGGASNTDPDSSLGGVVSSTIVKGLGSLVDSPIPSIRIDNVFPGSGEGQGSLEADANGDLLWTAPGGTQGTAVSIADGESRVVSGADRDEAVLVYKEAGLPTPAQVSTLTLAEALTGVLSQKNVTDAQRSGGVTTYRGLMLAAHGLYGVINIRLWLPVIGGAQATFSLATETPTGNSIQTIADEFTAPSGVSWVSPTVEGSALTIPLIGPGDYMGLWIRKVFPAAGAVSAKENVQLAMKFLGA